MTPDGSYTVHVGGSSADTPREASVDLDFSNTSPGANDVTGITVTEGDSVIIGLDASDPDGDALSYECSEVGRHTVTPLGNGSVVRKRAAGTGRCARLPCRPVALSRRVIAAVAVVAMVGAGVAGAAVLGNGSDEPGDAGSEPGDDVRTVQPGAPGEAGRELTDEEVAAIEAPEHNAADTAFMQGMLAHHAQAQEMADLVADRTDSDDIPLLAERIVVSQEAEITLIEEWLTDRGEAVPDTSGAGTDDHAGHDLMPGMATPEQLAALDAARGPAFDALFLELMTAHHQGALTMVEELYAAGGGIEPEADALARDVEADQAIEITRMTAMLSARGG